MKEKANRAFLLGILIISMPINIYLNQKYSDWCVYFLIGISLPTSFLFINIYRLKANSPELKQIQSNTKEAQEMIYEIQNKLFNYRISPNLLPKPERQKFSSIEVLEEPFNWILCIALFASLFMTATYQDFDINDVQKVIKFSVFTLMQIALMSAAISGMTIVIYRKIKGVNK